MDSGTFDLVVQDPVTTQHDPVRSDDHFRSEDARFVDALVANRPGAWREFQRRYEPLILRCIAKTTRRFASVTPSDVSDIYGQLLVSLLAHDRAKLRAFDPSRGSRFSSWLGMLAIHGAYDHLRSARREPFHEELSDAGVFACQEPDPHEVAVRRERASLAAKLLSGFSERDRVFATLYFGEGLEPTEIARSMNISLKTVYSKRHKIQAKLEGIVAKVRGEKRAS